MGRCPQRGGPSRVLQWECSQLRMEGRSSWPERTSRGRQPQAVFAEKVECMSVCVRVCALVCACVCTCVHACLCLCVHMCICMCACVPCVCACVHVRACACLCVRVQWGRVCSRRAGKEVRETSVALLSPVPFSPLLPPSFPPSFFPSILSSQELII